MIIQTERLNFGSGFVQIAVHGSRRVTSVMTSGCHGVIRADVLGFLFSRQQS